MDYNVPTQIIIRTNTFLMIINILNISKRSINIYIYMHEKELYKNKLSEYNRYTKFIFVFVIVR